MSAGLLIMRAGRIPSLDGLRAVAIGIVFLAHAGLQYVIPGYFGVLVFFLLSGFLITTLLRMEIERTGTFSLTSFYRRRIYRIWPPFYFFLALATLVQVLTNVGGKAIDWSLVGLQAVHWANYAIIEHGSHEGRAVGTFVLWSLAVEEHFYLIFPIILLIMLKADLTQRTQSQVLLAICIAVLAWRCILYFGLDAPKIRLYVATDTRFDAILIGCWLALAANPWLDPPRVSNRMLGSVFVPLGLLVVLVSFLPRQQWFDQTFRYTLQSIGLVPAFIACIIFHDRWPWKFLNYRFMRYLGVLSYSFYLCHATVIVWTKAWIGGSRVLQGVISFVVALLLSQLVHVIIEKPMASTGKWPIKKPNKLPTQ
jgi:peptidoglycan/LPS O-acetylase OafA/YrhL